MDLDWFIGNKLFEEDTGPSKHLLNDCTTEKVTVCRQREQNLPPVKCRVVQYKFSLFIITLASATAMQSSHMWSSWYISIASSMAFCRHKIILPRVNSRNSDSAVRCVFVLSNFDFMIDCVCEIMLLN